MIRKTSRTQKATKSGNGFHAPTEIQEILSKSERSICLPYELSIIEIDRILTAIKLLAGASDIAVELFKGSEKRTISSPSAFDIWEFIFDAVYQLPTAICMLVHEPTKSTVYWDDDERFVVVAGSKSFCESAFPHSRDVLEAFYVQSTINDFEDEESLRERFAELTSDE